MIGYFKVRIPRPKKPSIHNMLFISRFLIQKNFRKLRMFSCYLVLFEVHKKAEPTYDFISQHLK